MLAPTRDLVRELNERARTSRIGDADADRRGSAARRQPRIGRRHRPDPSQRPPTRRERHRLGQERRPLDRHRASTDGSLTVRHRDSGLTTVLPAEYVADHVELGYASTVHTAQGLTADVMHGIVTGEETRQLLYTMLTRGRAENHLHVIVEDLHDEHEFLPGINEQLTATEALDRILARDGAAVSATSTRELAAAPETRLHDAATRYADAVAVATQQVLGEDDEPGPPGPLPWLTGIPIEVADNPRWGPYLAARANMVRSLAAEVRDRADVTLPDWLDDYDDVLTSDLRGEIAVWRAARRIPLDERTIAGPPPDDDRAATYRHGLIRTVNSRHDDAVRVWEHRVVAYVGRADDQTLDLARELDRLRRQGRDPEPLLTRATIRRLPAEHPTAALAYRIRRLLAPPRRAPAQPGIEQRRPAPTTPSPGIGM